MSSLKALMQAKKATTRIDHPNALYTKDRLSCSLCNLPIKSHHVWASHLISKGHRVNVQKEAAAQAKAAAVSGKRKHAEDEEDGTAGKRPREDDSDGDEQKEEDASSHALPADFFADPSQAPVPASPEVEEEVVAEKTTEEAPVEDEEWAAFEASLQAGPSTSTTTVAAPSTAKATVFSAPVEYEFGAPKVAEEGEGDGGAEEEEEIEQEETEEERVERIDREEREELMEKIEEETRLQREADDKVEALKKRMEAMKEARRKKQAAKA